MDRSSLETAKPTASDGSIGNSNSTAGELARRLLQPDQVPSFKLWFSIDDLVGDLLGDRRNHTKVIVTSDPSIT
jgi:hypothetical protein